jgi:serine/threonine protein kinase/formylglycine-generating enzyme required for sulfatase activity
MPNKARNHPVIPDHDVLRKIGGGAYGEVWLARGVTGALRAVKVVWREDFEDERGFEREFEGILRFEPMSRDHPGLVDILHVGRSPDGVSFYYYVMELADDVLTGSDINPVEYEPFTLRPDKKGAATRRMGTGECIEVGLRLAEALGHLHERGLAHRDIKPSNIIFVDGKVKLADIGLVAARGQRTFVGTEGFVPPEGPGSAQADVYSLGKVLYEIATGKDRMDFPELPDELPSGTERKQWLGLNRVICEACDPQLSKRRITTAVELAEALRCLQRGKRRRRRGTAIIWTALVLGGFAALGVWELARNGRLDSLFASQAPPDAEPVAVADGMYRVVSYPEGADVLDDQGRWIGSTPTGTLAAKLGERVSVVIRKGGFKPLEVSEVLGAASASEPLLLGGELQIFSPPEIGAPWEDHLGNPYQPKDDEHVSVNCVNDFPWRRYAKAEKAAADAAEFLKIDDNGRQVSVVLADEKNANAFAAWLRQSGIAAGYLTEDHEAVPVMDKAFAKPGMSERAKRDGLRPFHILVRRIPYGSIELTTTPPGAEVYLNGASVGGTQNPLVMAKIRPGPVELLLVLEGCKPKTVTANVEPHKRLPLAVELQQNEGVVFGKPWKNGIGMRFVPMGADFMASIWETRVSDYDLFVRETKRASPKHADFPQGPDHPVVYVSRDDAVAFCEWLTGRERKQERISASHLYRLPTDIEWSRMAGLEEAEGMGPGWRDARKPKTFPWGNEWPPTRKVANLADLSAARAPGIAENRIIQGYDDGFETTAPVGSFPPNALGIYDLAGNAQEWVQDDYAVTSHRRLGILRGGGWNSYQPENLYTGARNAVPTKFRDNIYGFRVVLAKLPPKTENPAEPENLNHG